MYINICALLTNATDGPNSNRQMLQTWSDGRTSISDNTAFLSTWVHRFRKLTLYPKLMKNGVQLPKYLPEISNVEQNLNQVVLHKGLLSLRPLGRAGCHYNCDITGGINLYGTHQNDSKQHLNLSLGLNLNLNPNPNPKLNLKFGSDKSPLFSSSSPDSASKHNDLPERA